MKLRTKIAGTLALPLALAVAANVNAAQITDELKIGGFVAATADWTMYDTANGQDSDVDYRLDLGTSRINVDYTKNGVNVLYENDWAGGDNYRLRHAAISYDGWVAGFTWSGFANRTALAETIDASGPTSFSANANRTAKLGKTFNVADGMSVGVFIEDHSHGFNSDKKTSAGLKDFEYRDANGEDQKGKVNSAIPDVTLNFNGDFGATKVFAAARLLNIDDSKLDNSGNLDGKLKTKIAADFAVGVSQNLIDDTLNLKLAVLSLDKAESELIDTDRSEKGRDLGIQLGAQYKFNDQIRTNFVVEQVSRDDKNSDTTAFWLNGFYKLQNGWEWGAEYRYVSTDTVTVNGKKVSDLKVNGLGNKDMSISLLAKYSF